MPHDSFFFRQHTTTCYIIEEVCHIETIESETPFSRGSGNYPQFVFIPQRVASFIVDTNEVRLEL